MHDPLLFRRQLALRILGLVGAASLAACNGSGGAVGVASAGAGGGAASSSTHAGSGGMIGAHTSVGTGGMGGVSTILFDASIGSGGTGGGNEVITSQNCFDWPPDGGFPQPADAGPDAAEMLPFDAGPITDECPTLTALVLFEIVGSSNCSVGVWSPYAIASGPTRNTTNQCCYVVDLDLCVSGRPYMVEDRACVSTLHHGAGGWGEAPAPAARDALTAEARAALADAWAADALAEHASVASFSRFSLELLAAGAPAGLIELAHRAALDEIRHAELCFALASGYAGEALAPGPFPLGVRSEASGGVLLANGLAALAASTVKEGCVGETVAAVMAAEQLARATDPAVRAALERIAADEARHAELAWRTVAWALHDGGSEVRAAVTQAFAEALGGRHHAGGVACPGVGVEVLEAHGRLDPATAARVAASALAEVVGPSARALLAAARPGAPASVGTTAV